MFYVFLFLSETFFGLWYACVFCFDLLLSSLCFILFGLAVLFQVQERVMRAMGQMGLISEAPGSRPLCNF